MEGCDPLLHWKLQGRITPIPGKNGGTSINLFAPDEVRTRMEVVQARASTPELVPDTPLFAEIKIWFGTETASAG
jgi:hypothetical protein